MLDWALWYKERGLSIIPVSGKVPLIKWKEYQERCASEEEINQWWKEWPEADIGMVTGRISNWFVLDVDGPEGEKSIQNYSFPVTPRVKTKRGLQIYFRFPGTLEAKTTLAGILPGIDTRGEGGYCKLPPSLFSDGSNRYQWVHDFTTPAAEVPAWLIELMISKQQSKLIIREGGNESWLKDKLNGLREGTRNEVFTSISGSLRSRGYNSGDIFLLLKHHAEQHSFPLSELQTICNSVGQYQPKIVLNTAAQSVEDFLQEEQKVGWIVPGLIAKRSIGFIAGLPETNKTWCMLDLAIEVSKGGGRWLEKFPANGGKVLFIDQERWKGETQRRLKSVLSAKALNVTTQMQNLHIKCGTTIRLNLPHSYEAFRKELLDIKPDLVIVDSFATFHTVTENDRMEIQKVLEAIKNLRNEIGCTFLFINHESKAVLNRDKDDIRLPSATDMMGSIGVPAAAEVIFTVRRKDSDSCVVYQTKNTLGQKIEPFQVSVVDVEKGIQVIGV
jgi:hypothetical protein